MLILDQVDFLVEDTISKIIAAYKDTDGKMFLSFSGGKDSTVLLDIAKKTGLPIKVLFFDTGIELDAIYDFVKSFGDQVIWRKPKKPFGRIIKQYGVPFKSKYLSNYLKTYDRSFEKPFVFVRNNDLIKGTIHKIIDGNIVDTGQKITNGRALPKRLFHVLHPDRVNEYAIANQCCTYLKKDPSIDYIKESGDAGYFTGVRKGEGGVRKTAYTSCRSFKKVGNRTILQSMPLFDWDKQDIDDYIEKFNLPISRAYTEYGLDRTGCFCCPFSKYMQQNLEVLQKHEKNKYKAAQKWLGHVYMDMGVDLPNDPEYMEKKKERDLINQQRQTEMLEKFNKK